MEVAVVVLIVLVSLAIALSVSSLVVGVRALARSSSSLGNKELSVRVEAPHPRPQQEERERKTKKREKKEARKRAEVKKQNQPQQPTQAKPAHLPKSSVPFATLPGASSSEEEFYLDLHRLYTMQPVVSKDGVRFPKEDQASLLRGPPIRDVDCSRMVVALTGALQTMRQELMEVQDALLDRDDVEDDILQETEFLLQNT